jgi:hypothetical protein
MTWTWSSPAGPSSGRTPLGYGLACLLALDASGEPYEWMVLKRRKRYEWRVSKRVVTCVCTLLCDLAQVLAKVPGDDTAKLAEWAASLKDAGVVRFTLTKAPPTAEGAVR